jgi:1-acyl-sn-glycerol-3-phosphate acyltransferase
MFRLLCRVRIEGGGQIPRYGGVVLVSNHRSGFDTLLIPYSIFLLQELQIVWAPAKAELFRFALLRALLTSLGAFPVRRGQNDFRAMRQMLRYMRTDKMMLFPEGTRSRDGTLQAGNRTVGKLIYQTHPVVIPTAIVGTERIFARRQSLWRWRVPVSIRYGTPMDLQRYYSLPDTKETAEAILKEVMGAIAALLYNPSQASATSFRPSGYTLS